MDTLTFTAPQATLLVILVFLAGVGAATICQAIIRAALTATLDEPEPDVIVIEAPGQQASWRQEAGTKRATLAPARARFATPLPAVALSPAQWARRAFDDPRGVRLAVQIGASS